MITEKDLTDEKGWLLCEHLDSGKMMHVKPIEANNPQWLNQNGWKKVKLPEAPKAEFMGIPLMPSIDLKEQSDEEILKNYAQSPIQLVQNPIQHQEKTYTQAEVDAMMEKHREAFKNHDPIAESSFTTDAEGNHQPELVTEAPFTSLNAEPKEKAKQGRPKKTT